MYGPAEPLLRCAEGVVELIAIWFAEDKKIDVADGPLPGLPFMPGGPRSVDVAAADALDRSQDFSEDGGNTESLGQDVGEAGIVGAGGVRPHKPGVSHLPGGDQAGVFRAFDLPVD